MSLLLERHFQFVRGSLHLLRDGIAIPAHELEIVDGVRPVDSPST